MILAPAIMTAEPDPKKAGAKCLESVQLDPESYRIGHTRVNSNYSITRTSTQKSNKQFSIHKHQLFHALSASYPSSPVTVPRQ